MKNTLFYLALGFLFTHELDAMANSEWRVLPGLRVISDDLGIMVFVIAHIPLFALIVALVASEKERMRLLSRIGLCVFLVLHGLLHFLSSNDPQYEFQSTLSDALIYGGAVFGAAYFLLYRRDLLFLTDR